MAKMTSNGNETFVQKIIDKRTRKIGNQDKIEYLLKWTNGSEDSWEPEENLNSRLSKRKRRPLKRKRRPPKKSNLRLQISQKKLTTQEVQKD
jgi:predicted N-acyltransferase